MPKVPSREGIQGCVVVEGYFRARNWVCFDKPTYAKATVDKLSMTRLSVHPERVSDVANRCRRVFSCAELGMLRQAQHDEIVRHPEPVSVFYEPKSKGISVHGTGYASTGSA